MKDPVGEALDLICHYGMIDGAHHKQWVLDQVVRALTEDEEGYQFWIKCVNVPGYEPWDEGIAP